MSPWSQEVEVFLHTEAGNQICCLVDQIENGNWSWSQNWSKQRLIMQEFNKPNHRQSQMRPSTLQTIRGWFMRQPCNTDIIHLERNCCCISGNEFYRFSGLGYYLISWQRSSVAPPPPPAETLTSPWLCVENTDRVNQLSKLHMWTNSQKTFPQNVLSLFSQCGSCEVSHRVHSE